MSSGDPGPRIKSLKDYNGRTRYSIYLLNQLNRLKVPVEDHVNHFLSYQDEDTVDAFYEYHSDYTLATWTDVEEFCEKRQPHTVKPFILRVTEVMEARRLPDELPNSYYNRLLSILAFSDMKEATTLVTLKLFDLPLALSEWKKFLDRSKLREHFNDSYSKKIFRQPLPTPVKFLNASVTPDTKPVVVNPLKTSRPNDSSLPTPPATPRRSKDEITCFNCKEKGHYASTCPKRNPVTHKNNAIVSDQVFSMSPRVFEVIMINGEYIKVLIDSGTTVNILPKSLTEQLHVTVVPTKDSIQYGGGYVATPHGESVLSMFFIGSESTYTAKFLITDDEYPMITMESALALNINYQERLQSMLHDREKVVKTLNEIADQSLPVAHSLIENQSLWDESISQPTELMKLPFIEVPKSLLVKPYDLKSTDRPKVAMEIAHLLRLNQLLPIKLPIFSSPITSVISPNKTRICHDSRKLNQYMSNVDLQLPKLEEILGCISNQEDLVFVQLDLRDAFKLIGIADEHQQYSTISTVWGNFYSPLLQFGYRCTPGMFHNYFASLLNTQEFPDCIQYMDDIIFYEKIDSLLGESKPDSITGMRSVIGKINHISKFISNYGQIMSSLHPKSESKFVWSKRRTQD
uniref:CCHC-type domain-containing protein n=1 Tax=Strongyloides venezuelensis TaxID=75913 RepID=A0A0K0FHQ8_STRVS